MQPLSLSVLMHSGLIFLKSGKCYDNISSLYVLPSSASISATVLTDTWTAFNCTCLMISKKTALSLSFFSKTFVLSIRLVCVSHSV